MTSESNTHPTPGAFTFNSAEPSPSAESPPSTVYSGSLTGPAFDAQAYANIPAPPGASVYPPAAAVSAALNPRSCVTCRRRKVRCDKHMPCGNCRRAQISCIFPAPGRAPRRPRPKDPNAPPKQHSSEREIELVKRLRKLEGIVEELSGQIELEAVRHSSDGHSPETASDGDRQMYTRPDAAQGSGSQGKGSPAASSGGRKEGSSAASLTGSSVYPTSQYGGLKRTPTELNKNFGRLVLNDKGTSRYVSSGFWSKINDELNEMRAATQNLADDDDSDESDDESTLNSLEDQSVDHQSFIMGYRSADVDLRPLHPLPSQIPFMWQIYQENVDPVLKILHVPSMEQLIRERRACLGTISPSNEALMFSIYYAAVASMEEEEVTRSLGAEKPFLLNQYRFAVEQALAKANFITDPDFTVCQAFVIFLVLVRRHEKPRFSWTLTGLAVRLCQAIGLHRDGTNFPHLKPFEIEMRRRLFWSLLMLDLRSAEDQGTECIISDSFDTQLPLNINDADISPDSTELPQSREGPTDMTFCLLRFEICNLARKMHHASTTVAPDMTREETLAMLQERESMLLELYNTLEMKYLSDSSAEENPMYWVVGNIARVIVAKMITVIYQPILFALPVDSLSCRLRERLFLAAVEIFEYNHILNTDPRCRQWRWLFQTYTQWHAVAYLLLELCNRTWSATSERAWAAINACFSGPNSLALEKMSGRAAIWLPFKKLYHRAKKHRDTELARLRADPAAAEKCDQRHRARDPPSSFGALSNSIKCSIAHERWRKLVNLPPNPGPLPSIEASDRHEGVATVPQPRPVSAASRDNSDASMDYSTDPIDELVGAALTRPLFTSTELYPLVFHRPSIGNNNNNNNNNNNPTSQARGDSVFGFSSVDIPAHDHNIAGPTSVAQEAAVSTTSKPDDDNPPVWLWNLDDVHKINRAGSGGTPAGQDADVNMDEEMDGFDWQNWQASARGFELETDGTSGINGVWGMWYGI